MSDWIYVHDLDPIIATIGPLRVGWYGLMYAITFMIFYFFTIHRSKKDGAPLNEDQAASLITYIILGVILGARLGWVIFYGGLPYLENPLRIFETWKGGMSFHGGMLGVLVAMIIFTRKHKISLLRLADFAIPMGPVGLFFGRIGNFINGELFGKFTDGTWGVIFKTGGPQPRHPSQLYEALGEGIATFLILILLQKPLRNYPGLLSALFLACYGLFRSLVELVRLPDRDIGYLAGEWLTMGMLLSLPMLFVGLGWGGYILYTSKKTA